MKICTKCHIEKPLNKFRKYISKNISPVCTVCTYKQKRNIAKPIVSEKICYECKILKKSSEFHKHNKKPGGLEAICKYCRKEKSKSFYEKHKEKIKTRIYARYEKIKRTEEFRIKKRAHQKNLNESAKIARRLRNRLYYSLKNKTWKKNTHFVEYIGCDRDTLIRHLESQFKNGMSWDNFNEWHIDHIIPLSSAETEEDLYKLCHYTNLQPLWAKDNLSKYNKTMR